MINWGVLGAGKISSDFVSSINNTSHSNCTVVAIGSRSQEKSDEFASSHDIPYSYGSYEEVWKNEEVGVIYIGTIHPTHFELAKACLEHGKHLLIEKPITMNVQQYDILRNMAQEKGLFLMQALWSRYFPAVQKVKEMIISGVIGDVSHVSGNFGFQFDDVPRLSENKLGGGALLDIGVYLISFTFLAFQSSSPSNITAVATLKNGVDWQTNMIFQFETGSASLTCGFNGEYTNEFTIIGTKGSLKFSNPFWCPTEVTVTLKDQDPEVMKFPLPETEHKFNFHNSVGLAYEAEYVNECLRSERLESEHETLEEVRNMMKTMDTIREQIGLLYDADN